jgi:hypothetical protein
MEEVEESEPEEERAPHLDNKDRETRTAVVHTQARHACVDERKKRSDVATRADDMWMHVEEDVLLVSTSAHDQEKKNIMIMFPFRPQLAKPDRNECMASNTPKVAKLPPKKVTALGTGDKESSEAAKSITQILPLKTDTLAN